MLRSGPSSSRTRRRGNTPEAPSRPPLPVGDVVSSTFANADLRMTRAAMAEYTRRCTDLSRANAELREQLRDQSADSVKVVQHLESRLQSTEAALAEQRREVSRLLHDAAVADVALRQQYERVVEQRDEQVAQYATLVKRLQTELLATAHHVRQREEQRLELQKLHDRLEEMTTRHESELAALRFQTVDRKMRLVALEEAMRAGFESQVEAESARLLDAKSHALLEDHGELQRERVRLTQDIEELVQLTATMGAEGAEVRRRAALQQHACQEALRRIVQGNRRARETEMRTQRLEQRVRELLQERRTMREELSREYEARIKQLDTALADTRTSLHAHRAELRRLRHVAATVVGQRSELERFFYVALHDVRRMRSGTSSLAATSVAHTTAGTQQASNKGSSTPSTPHQRHIQSLTLSQMHLQHVSPLPTPPLQLQHPLLSPPPSQPPQTVHLPFVVGAEGTQRHVVRSTGTCSSGQNGNENRKNAFLTSLPVAVGGGRAAAAAVVARGDLRLNLGNSDVAYLEDLSWEDKEKIIKAMLFFINRTCFQRLSGSHIGTGKDEEGDDDDDEGKGEEENDEVMKDAKDEVERGAVDGETY